VRIATGDVTGDGVPDIVTAPGSGTAPEVRVFNLASGSPVQYAHFMGSASKFKGGLYVAVGDVNGDGRGDVITGQGNGGDGEVRVFSGTTLRNTGGPTLLGMYSPFPGFHGDVRVAAVVPIPAGHDDILIAAGAGGPGRVLVWNPFGTGNKPLIDDFFPYDPKYTGGIFVGAVN
jgi:hypothetical protein